MGSMLNKIQSSNFKAQNKSKIPNSNYIILDFVLILKFGF
jgi:hypothetical protein